ncbi:MAG: TIGR04372 family glycosyltransferase [Candidatus Omnitrophota bacterium]|nr:TIGR04372 family glycosyltransferase [Candidatus Omnitrophota bacterium]
MLLRKTGIVLLTPVLLLMVLCIRLLRPLVLIRFGGLISSRIGHFAGNIELYLCDRDFNKNKSRKLDIFYHTSFICNRQLEKMWRRVLRISPIANWLDKINRFIPGWESHEISSIATDRDICGLLESTQPHLSFTLEEELFGQKELQKLGISKGASFICFLSRDSAYLNKLSPDDNWSYHDYRDSNIKNFVSTIEELTRRGYFALRMGTMVKQPLETTNPMIVDYAVKHRTEFLDIFLGAKCHFYLGDSCGFHAIPVIFRRPLAIVNMVPLEYVPTWSSDYLFIPKKLWLRGESRFLTFREILGSEKGRMYNTEEYEKLGIEVIENTPEEITSVAVEMDERLKGEWKTTEKDEKLQKMFRLLFRPSRFNGKIVSRIGAEFLRQNKGLLE